MGDGAARRDELDEFRVMVGNGPVPLRVLLAHAADDQLAILDGHPFAFEPLFNRAIPISKD